MSQGWRLLACGCGTASYWVIDMLGRRGLLGGVAHVALCDRAEIREQNAVTCPQYTEVGRLKCDRLAELTRPWLPAETAVETIYGNVEQIPWQSHLPATDEPREQETIVLVGLDCWDSRLAVAEDLRRYCGRGRTTMIQVGLDRGQAGVAVFGCRFADPCPACGLGTLPESEPCVVLGANHELLRGNLHSEAAAAADVVRQVVADILAGRWGDWVNTKTNLVAAQPSGGGRYRRFTRRRRRVAGCLGPHSPATPIRWDGLLEPVTTNGAL